MADLAEVRVIGGGDRVATRTSDTEAGGELSFSTGAAPNTVKAEQGQAEQAGTLNKAGLPRPPSTQPSFPHVTADAALLTPALGRPPTNPAWQAAGNRDNQEGSRRPARTQTTQLPDNTGSAAMSRASSVMLANLTSTGDIHVSLPAQKQLTLTAAAVQALRPAARGRTDTSGLSAAGLLNLSGTDGMRQSQDYNIAAMDLSSHGPPSARDAAASGAARAGVSASAAAWQDDPRGGASTRGGRTAAGTQGGFGAGSGGGAAGGGGGGPGRKPSAALTMSRASTLENEKAVDKIVSEMREETARLGRERKYRRVSYTAVWTWVVVLAWITGWSIAAVLLDKDEGAVEFLHLYDWRWCVVAACAPAVWWLPHQLMFLIVLVLEAHQSTGDAKSRTIYYLMGIRTHMVALLRMLLALIVIHYVVAQGMDEQYSGPWERIFVKLWICASLFCFGNVLKTIIARALSKHFHTKSYFTRMKEAVQKEYFLLALTKPQPPTRYLFDPHAQGSVFQRTGLTRVTVGFANLLASAAAEGKAAAGTDGTNTTQRSAAGSVLGAVDEGREGAATTHHHGRSQSAGTARSPATGGETAPHGRGGAGIHGAGGVQVQAHRGIGIDGVAGAGGRGRAGRDEESAPLLASNGFGSSTAPCRASAADSPFASASGLPPAAATSGGSGGPTFARPSDVSAAVGGGSAGRLHAARSLAAAASNQKVQVTRAVSGVMQRLKESYQRAMLYHRHGAKGDVVTTVVGPHGPTPMLRGDAAKAAAAANTASPAVVADGPVWEERVHGQGWWDNGTHEPECGLGRGRGDGGGRPSMDRAGSGEWLARTAGTHGSGPYPSNASVGSCARGVGPAPGPRPGAGGRVGPGGKTTPASGHKRRDAKDKQKVQREMETSLYWLEQHIRQNKLRYTTLTDQLGAAAELPDMTSEVSNKRDARRLAFYLYWNVLGHNMQRPFVVPRDLEDFFDNPEEVKACFEILDTDGDGRATLENIVDAIVAIYKERKKLALTLKDTKSVVSKLELVCGVVIHIALLLVYFWIFEVDVNAVWVSLTGLLLSFTFVFGSSLKSLYESVVFLFICHTFDVGDWLQLGNGDLVKVEEIALLSITAVRGDGRRLYIPTSRMMAETTINLSRSETFWDNIAILVDASTPASVLEALESGLKAYTASQPREFTGSAGVIARTMDNPVKLKIVAFWEFNHCADDTGRTGRWRSALLLVVCDILRKQGVLYTNPPEAPYPLPAGTVFWDPTDPQSGEDVMQGGGVQGPAYLHTRTGSVFARGNAAAGMQPGFGANAGGAGGVAALGGLRFRGKALAKQTFGPGVSAFASVAGTPLGASAPGADAGVAATAAMAAGVMAG